MLLAKTFELVDGAAMRAANRVNLECRLHRVHVLGLLDAQDSPMGPVQEVHTAYVQHRPRPVRGEHLAIPC